MTCATRQLPAVWPDRRNDTQHLNLNQMNPLKNPDAEACAQSIAAVMHDKVKRQELFSAYLNDHPEIKKWEGHAIGNRAVWLGREAAYAQHNQAMEKALA